jgi:hypothetical protein
MASCCRSAPTPPFTFQPRLDRPGSRASWLGECWTWSEVRPLVPGRSSVVLPAPFVQVVPKVPEVIEIARAPTQLLRPSREGYRPNVVATCPCFAPARANVALLVPPPTRMPKGPPTGEGGLHRDFSATRPRWLILTRFTSSTSVVAVVNPASTNLVISSTGAVWAHGAQYSRSGSGPLEFWFDRLLAGTFRPHPHRCEWGSLDSGDSL